MKILLFLALSVFSLAAFAQNLITVDVVPLSISKDEQHSFIVEIPQTTLKDVEKDWVKYVGTGSKGKAVLVDGVHQQSGAFNGNISAYSFNVHSKLLETSVGVRLTVWLTQNKTAFISTDTNSGQGLAVQKYVRDFAVQEYRQVVQKELKAEQDKQAELEKELATMIKQDEKSLKKISENKRSNERANDAIVTNNDDIQSSSDKISDQKEMVEMTSADSKATKGAQKTLDNLEDEKKDLQAQNETEGRNIDSRNKETREEERSTIGSKQSRELKTADIEKQKQIVHDVKIKLDNIQ